VIIVALRGQRSPVASLWRGGRLAVHLANQGVSEAQTASQQDKGPLKSPSPKE